MEGVMGCDPDAWRNHDYDDIEIEVDVCMSCGRYYGMTQSLKDLWYSSDASKRPGAVMAQLCFKCMGAEYGITP
jgi:hypothetical protein